VTLTVHNFIQDGGQCGRSVLVGDDFEEILGILKGDEDLDEQFTVEVTNVSITAGNLAVRSLILRKLAAHRVIQQTLAKTLGLY